MIGAGVDLSPSSSGTVILSGDRPYEFRHFEEVDTKWNFTSRRMMAARIYNYLVNRNVQYVAIEDYDLNPNQQVGMQIAETTGIFKNMILENLRVPIYLIHPAKRTSWVERRKGVTKKDCIEYAIRQGLQIPPKKRGQPGLTARQREDLADAFIVGQIGAAAHAAKLSQIPPKAGDIVLDPDRGVAYNPKAFLTWSGN